MQRYNMQAFCARNFNINFNSTELARIINEALPTLTPEGPWLAGGSLRRYLSMFADNTLPMSDDYDYDIFFSSEEQLEHHINTKPYKYKLFKVSSLSYSYAVEFDKQRLIVQYIKYSVFPSVEALLNNFDITVCQFAYDGTDLICGDFSLYDLACKRLMPHNLKDKATLPGRLIKYKDLGFVHPDKTFMSVINSLPKDTKRVES